jgi:hypothetical protein
MATSVLSNVWHGVSLCSIKPAHKNEVSRIVVTACRYELRRLGFPMLVGLSVGMLACAQKTPPAPPQVAAVQPPPPPPAPPQRRRIVPPPPRKPIPPSDASGLESPSGMTTALADSDTVPTPNASELIGLNEADATRLFGAANQKLDAPPATVWRYRGANCELDLIFYLDLHSGEMRTLRYAIKGEPAGTAGHRNCLHSLVVARGA